VTLFGFLSALCSDKTRKYSVVSEEINAGMKVKGKINTQQTVPRVSYEKMLSAFSNHLVLKV
jgi:hypothetical protein